MNDQRRIEMAALVDTFDDQYRKGVLSIDLYAHSMVVCASEYVRQGEMKLGTDLLRRCPATYFEGPLLQQMADDKRFELLAFDVATALDAAGLVKELEADGIKFTQAVGRA
jgi:hypothetical protein